MGRHGKYPAEVRERAVRLVIEQRAEHGSSGDIFDAYTTLPWATLCEAVGYLKVGIKEGKVVSIRAPQDAAELLAVGDGLETEASGAEAEKERAASSLACGP